MQEKDAELSNAKRKLQEAQKENLIFENELRILKIRSVNLILPLLASLTKSVRRFERLPRKKQPRTGTSNRQRRKN